MSIIEVNNLGKKYKIGEKQNYVAMRDVLTNLVKAPGRLFKGEKKDNKEDKNIFWALKDLNFKVNQGEVLGIIGRNGAGKSTLLKILSQITPPTTGEAKLKGKVGSLLEVGTGFHPELTGRENIYLNGSILGMRKKEIAAKFDDIVEFSGVKKFLDTPVKRYSSGMYVRLAFAVAAHLEPDILLVDEVLAVGDVEFQKKCLGKMSDVTKKEGRTVLFVSHNMGAVRQLCNRIIVLEDGQIVFDGDTDKGVREYINNTTKGGKVNMKSFDGTLVNSIDFEKISVNEIANGGVSISPADELKLNVGGICKEDIPDFRITFSVYKEDIRLFSVHDSKEPKLLKKGKFNSQVIIPPFYLRPGDYSLAIGGYGLAGKWIYGTYLVNFSVAEEWSSQNEYHNFGLFNLPYECNREQK